jgi:hypothetical protein
MDRRPCVTTTRGLSFSGSLPIQDAYYQPLVRARKFIGPDSDLATSAGSVPALVRDNATPDKSPDERC